jgi:polyisoprenoid-binding protein YceI
MIKKASLLILLTFRALGTFAQVWKMDKSHSKLGFTVTHLLISEVDGNFKNFDVVITSSKEDFSDAVVELTAYITSINADNERRNGHLRVRSFLMELPILRCHLKANSLSSRTIKSLT